MITNLHDAAALANIAMVLADRGDLERAAQTAKKAVVPEMLQSIRLAKDGHGYSETEAPRVVPPK